MKLILAALAFLVTGALAVEPAFPLKVADNGRYLADSKGAPFLYHADTGWRLFTDLTTEEALHYLNDRRAKGFTAIQSQLVVHRGEGKAVTREGIATFLDAKNEDIAQPNPAYFAHAEKLVEQAADRGLLMAMSSLWFGYKGTGYFAALDQTKARAFGRYLGERFKRFDNVIWMHGGDFRPGGKTEAVRELAAGLRETAPHHLQTFHNGENTASTEDFADDAWLDIDMVESVDPPETYSRVLAAYERKQPRVRPVILGEPPYENERKTDAFGARSRAWWTMTSGAAGHAFGVFPVWRFGKDWQPALQSPGSHQMKHLRALLEACRWPELVPDEKSEIVTDGRGQFGSTDFVTVASTRDGRLALAYMPTTSTITVNLSKFSGPVRATWFDPVNGARNMEPDAFKNSGERKFSHAMKNAGGDSDWVLVLETEKDTARAADFSVREHGATGDGTTLDTAALQRAIEACGKAGGGRVVFPPGKYLSGTLHMRSGVELHLEKDARLIGTTDLAAYAGFSPEAKKLDLPTSRRDRALIIGEQVKGIAFTGEGVIDGNKVFDPQGEEKMRGPHTILLGFCDGVTLRGLTIYESANYAFLIYGCDKVRVEDATFEGGWDGVHFRGWPEKWNRDLRVTGCRFFTGDDSIAGNYVEDGVIERCVINSSCNGVRLIGPARRLAFKDCEFFGPGKFPHRTSDRTNMLAALCLQPSAWGKEEGPMEDVSARDCTMRDVACAFHIVTKPGNTAQRLTFERIKATGIYRAAASVESWGERTFRDVVFRDVSLEYTGGGTAEDAAKPVPAPGFDARKLPAWGFYHRNTEDILLEHVTLTLRAPDARPALRTEDAPAPRLIEFSAPVASSAGAADAYQDRVRGAWAGQILGAAAGSAPGIKLELNAAKLAGAAAQSSLRVQFIFLQALERHGEAVSRPQIAALLGASDFPLSHAGLAARQNLRRGMLPDFIGHPRFNPHSDDHDFQASAAVLGLVTPGLPRAAATLADVFGGLMSYGDGQYGGRFLAATVARAFLENGASREAIERCVRSGVTAIHPDSAYAAVAREVFAQLSRDPDDWQKARAAIEARWGESDLCPHGAHEPANFDAKLNGGFIMIGLLYGQGDLARTLKIVADCGQQVRENSAAAAGILGALSGAKELCREAGVDEAAISHWKVGDQDLAALVRGCESVARKSDGADQLPLRMDGQAAAPPSELEQMHAAFNRRQLQQWNAATAAVFFDKMPQWDADWELVSTGYDGAPSLRKFQGKPAVLVTHPVDKVEPATLQRTLQLPQKNPRLLLSVASFPDAATDDKKSVADWLLRVVVNGKPILEKVIDTEDRWEEVSVDLSRYAGQTVVLALENAPGGAVEFAYETAYWASAEIVGE